MTRILVITSCTGEKAVTSDRALTLDDFSIGGEHLKRREDELQELMRSAEELYTGQQHVRLMRGIEAIREQKSDKRAPTQLDLWVLSAGYGLVPGERKLAPYECTFQGMKSKELRSWADKLNVPQQFREIVKSKYDLALILLGDSYLAACSIDATLSFGGPTLLFCGTGAAKKLPKHPQIKVTTLSNPDAKRFSCPLVSIKGEIASRLMTQFVSDEQCVLRISAPEFDILKSIEKPQSVSLKRTVGRINPIANPLVDRVIDIPESWWKCKHKEKLQYFIPEWDDLVDPDFDFIKDEHSGGSGDWSNNTFAHQMYSAPCYDGLLVSKVVAEKSTKKKARINSLGVHRYLRVPNMYPIMGDCGAFGYIKEEVPPYTTEEILDYYSRLGFDYGVSIDHLIVSATESQKQFRYELTLENASEFLKKHKKARLPWVPIGAVQGWDPKSYKEGARQCVAMGYQYIGLGGLVRSSTSEILEILTEVKSVVPSTVGIHLFGLARISALLKFAEYGVRSVDSASFLRRAWMGSAKNYVTTTGNWYSAIRIPGHGKSFRAKRMITEGRATPEKVEKLEKDCLKAMHDFDRGKISVDKTLDILEEYDQLITPERPLLRNVLRQTLEAAPWKQCPCEICRKDGVEVIIFRGNNRNRRRGFHNSFVFYEELKRVLAGLPCVFNNTSTKDLQPSLFPMEESDELE